VPQPELDDALDAADKFVSVEAAIARRLSGQKLSQLTAAARELGAPHSKPFRDTGHLLIYSPKKWTGGRGGGRPGPEGGGHRAGLRTGWSLSNWTLAKARQ
jgi:hypothetical protein